VKRWSKRIGVALGALLVALLVYGVLVEPRLILDEERAEVPMPRLGEELAGTEVAVISDFQLGMWFANTGMVSTALETAVDAEPDAVLLGGDFVYSTEPDIETQIDTLLELLAPLLESGIPTFAVLGNHDHAVGAADELTAALEDAGIPVLLNEAAPLPGPVEEPEQRLHVVGIGPETPGLADVDEALAAVPDDAPRVVLMHNPTVFDELPADAAPLALAGHTHCGQVTLPGSPNWSYIALTEEEKVVADGWAPADHGAEGNRLFVTCGIGFSLAPIRINAPPQVAFFELQPGD
jgi:predicted MPP superfamily phosphohydrolase